jgi:hypothetical protein
LHCFFILEEEEEEDELSDNGDVVIKTSEDPKVIQEVN